MRGHRRRRGLAVRARDGDHPAHRHGLGEQLAAVVHGTPRSAATTSGSVGGDRGRDDQLGAGERRARRRGRPAARSPRRAARRSRASRPRRSRVTSAPSACAIRASPLIPAPPMPTKCSSRPRHGWSSPPPPGGRRRQHLRGDPLRGVGTGHRARGLRHLLQAARVAEQRRSPPRPSGAASSSSSAITRPRPRPPSSAHSWPGGPPSRAGTGRGSRACPPRRSRRRSRPRARSPGRAAASGSASVSTYSITW